MSSLAPSSSVFMPPPPALAHTLNSRGELGMFVNPYGCPCQTCVDYIAERAPETAPAPAPADHLWTGSEWAPLESSSLSFGMGAYSSSVAIEGWGGEELPLFGADLLPAPALARTVTGLGYTPSAAAEDAAPSTPPRVAATLVTPPAPIRVPRADVSIPPPSLPRLLADPLPRRELDHVDELMDRLRGLRSELQLAQDDVYRGTDHRSHDEMAAADMQFDEMDRQISAIEQVMLSFGAIFRHR